MAELNAVYAALHKIMAPYAARLNVKRNDTQELYLDTRHLQQNKKALFFGAVQVKKSYVAFHLMPVYLNPALLDPLSPELKARMQGKSCFNFKVAESVLFKELAALTRLCFESYEAQGFVGPQPGGGDSHRCEAALANSGLAQPPTSTESP